MILDFKTFLFIAMLSLCVKSNNCNSIDTIFLDNDTIIKELQCYETGNKKYLRSKKNGKIHGKCKAWYPNGQLIYIAHYKNGEPDGLRHGWDSTGFLSLEKNYNNGKPIGKHKHFYGKNKPKEFTNYNDSGQKHGLCESWREDGIRKDSIVYYNGNIIELRAYFLNGKVRHWIKKVDRESYKTLEAFYYDTSGAVCGEIKNGNGTYILWSDDAKERWIETYKDGEEVASRKLKPDENPDWK